MAGRDLFAVEPSTTVKATSSPQRKGRDLFAEGIPSPGPSLKILKPTAPAVQETGNITGFGPFGAAFADDPQAAERPILETIAEKAKGVGEFLGLEKITDPLARTAARVVTKLEGTDPEVVDKAIPEPSTGELVGAGLQVGALLIPYGQLQTALAKGFGRFSSVKVAAALAAATAGATGGFTTESGMKIQRGEAPTPGITTLVSAALPGSLPIIRGVINKSGKALSQVLGLSTGTGPEAIKQAFRGGKGFKAGLQGKLIADDVLDSATDALYDLRTARGEAYQSQLAKIEKLEGVVIDSGPVNSSLDRLLKSFRVKLGADKNGKLIVDMSRSRLDRSARGPMTELIEDVRTWDDWTPIGADTLKQRIDDFYAPTKNSRAFSTALRNEVKKEIVKKVPQYNKLTKDYAKASRDIDDIQKNLLAGKQDTAIRRLNTVFRDVNEYRLGVIDKLDAATGTKLREQLAGISLSRKLPRGYLSKILPAGAAAAAGAFNPLAGITILAATSPRLVGGAVRRAGQVSRAAQAVTPLNAGILPRAGIEAGRRADDGEQL